MIRRDSSSNISEYRYHKDISSNISEDIEDV